MRTMVRFLNLMFDRMSQPEAVRLLLECMLTRCGKRVFFVNANSAVIAAKTAAFHAALKNSDLVLADGSGILWGSAMVGKPLRHNLNGTDLVPELCGEAARHGLSVFLLGGKPGVAEAAAEKLRQRHASLIIVGTAHGYFKPEESQQVVAQIQNARPHLLLVAFGSPLQEIWINEHFEQLSTTVCLGVGGLFDFIAQRVPRAPGPMRKIGVEWVWRLAMEPKRLWRRYLIGNLVYVGLLAKVSLKDTASLIRQRVISLAPRSQFEDVFGAVPHFDNATPLPIRTANRP